MTDTHTQNEDRSPLQKDTGSRETIDAFEIFPWSGDFETGIATVDDQHQILVRLLNTVARNLALKSESLSFAGIMAELTAYTIYHFDAEEDLMRKFFANDALEYGHRQAHQDFVRRIGKLQEHYATKPLDEAVEEVIAILTRWLAFHILDTDRRMAKVILAIQTGLPLDAAKIQVDREMSGAVKVLVDAVLGMYERLSSRTFQLMKEIVERRSAEIQLRRAAIVFENTLEAIFVTDAHQRIIDVNPSFCEISGQGQANLVGRPLGEAMADMRQANLTTDIWNTVQQHGHWSGEVSSRASSGEDFRAG